MPALRSPLTIEERAAKHRLMARDTVALSTLLSIVLTLTFITYALFHSFAAYRLKLEQRWKARGEAALANHRPQQAIESLRSALAYSPDDRTLQIELATALAAAGRTQEAVVYFDTLHEAEPGNGMINVQLARLAVTQHNAPLAIDDYEAAVDGTWNGDGVVRRREVRLELARYLIDQHRFDEAKNQLLIAAGNAADNHQLQLTVAALLEQARGEVDAYNLYRKAAAFHDTRTLALIGAGRTSATQGRYLLARNMLQQAVAQPDFAHLPDDQRTAARGLLNEAIAILDIFPAENLPPNVRAVRVLHAVQVVRAQMAACAAAQANVGGAESAALAGSAQAESPAPQSGKQPSKAMATGTHALPTQISTQEPPNPESPTGALRTAITAVQRAGSTLAGVAGGNAPAPLALPQASDATPAAALAARWSQLPPDAILERRMERDPALLENTLQLVYEVEESEAQLASTIGGGLNSGKTLPGCVPPSPDAELLLKIAAAPDQVEQQ
jgi:Tfp pilus assembly protein PilF